MTDRLPEVDWDYYKVREDGVYGPRGLVSTHVSPYGRVQLSLRLKSGKYQKFLFHRVLAYHFIPNPDGLPEINHKDCDPLNNKLSNLEWCTRQENVDHAWENRLIHRGKGSENHQSKLTEEDVLDMRWLFSLGVSKYRLAKEWGVNYSTAYNAIDGKKTWIHV